MLTFNPENQTYSKLIHIDEFPEMQKKMEQIAERVKNAPVFPANSYETDAEICIDNIDDLKKLLEDKNFKINSSINRRRATLFLVACYFCSEKELWSFCLNKEVKSTELIYLAIMR